MRFLIYTVLCLIFAGCSERSEDVTKSESELPGLVNSIGCELIDPGSNYPLETRDREFYKPYSFEIGNIRTLKPLDGYHGPTIGRYIIAIEKYASEVAAKKRANEYQNLDRLAMATGRDENELSKMTVRCWAISEGSKVYLLTTLGAGQAALEARTGFVENGVKQHIKLNSEPQGGAGQPATRSESPILQTPRVERRLEATGMYARAGGSP